MRLTPEEKRAVDQTPPLVFIDDRGYYFVDEPNRTFPTVYRAIRDRGMYLADSFGMERGAKRHMSLLRRLEKRCREVTP